MDSAVIGGVFLTNGTAVVRGTVIDEDQLKIPEGLGKNAVHRFAEIFFYCRQGELDNLADADGRM